MVKSLTFLELLRLAAAKAPLAAAKGVHAALLVGDLGIVFVFLFDGFM